MKIIGAFIALMLFVWLGIPTLFVIGGLWVTFAQMYGH